MGIFGKSKKEYQNEIDGLKELISPDAKKVAELKQQITELENQRANIDNNIAKARTVMQQTEFEIAKKTEQLKNNQAVIEQQGQAINFNNQLIGEQAKYINLKNAIIEQNNIIAQNKRILGLQEQSLDLHKVIEEQKQTIANNNKEIEGHALSIEMQEYGIYRPTYNFSNSDLYAERLKLVRDQQKETIKNGKACTGNINWTVNGSASQGKKMVNDMTKLLMRAFNLECDDLIANVKISNAEKSKERIYKTAEQISKLGAIMSISITKHYIKLKIEELNLALDFAQKKQEEKDRIREEKERQKEEAKVQKEIEEARKKLAKEQSHYQNALSAIIEQIKNNPENADLQAKKQELENNIEEVNKAIIDVDYREANRKAGYIYIISNIGAFGENVYKIGMTRRLEPMERINELGDASVPFSFDVHALIFTEDAPGLEAALHNAFDNRKINKINKRKEFFRVTLEEIKRVVRQNFDKTVEWIDIAEAEQYRQSIIMKS